MPVQNRQLSESRDRDACSDRRLRSFDLPFRMQRRLAAQHMDGAVESVRGDQPRGRDLPSPASFRLEINKQGVPTGVS